VTSCNVLYRLALKGNDVFYLDFDFGSPTSGAIFNLAKIERGVAAGGLHSYLLGRDDEPARFDVWADSERQAVRTAPHGIGQLTFMAGDIGGGEFATTPDIIERCASLFVALEQEFEVSLIDLSAGRSYAVEIVLAATARPELARVRARWLVFHRWTRQHVLAAAGLAFGERGIVDGGVDMGHDKDELTAALRFVRTAVLAKDSPEMTARRDSQVAWLLDRDRDLQQLAGGLGLGFSTLLGAVPLDPVLQLREQLISDYDVQISQIANAETVLAFAGLAESVLDDAVWKHL
jgi:hypothetical protein